MTNIFGFIAATARWIEVRATALGYLLIQIGGYGHEHVTADTQIKATEGTLHIVTVNSCGTAGTLTLYDSATEAGTVIAAIAIPINTTPFTLHYDLDFGTALYAGFDGTLAADVTISYR